ncbi:NB-ARC domain-containing protein [Kamptonema formosum]|uniref:NB-ARC domain-containing protein n=1 Tax=Kamptonema formosum TaxID=331992 RepID=UPI000346DE0B|nr:NB-ARC domain-containing protein [Oscillatoria sp. PCC 10802]
MAYKPDQSKLFGAAIKHLLQERNLTQRQFAANAKLDPSYVSKLVNGEIAEPRQDKRRKIAKGLDVTEPELQQLVAQYIEDRGVAGAGGSTSDAEANTTPDTPSVPPQSPRGQGDEGEVFRRIPHNLPAPTYTAFIGRNEEMRRLLQLLSPEHSAHMITVDGIGGVGKTALVVEAAYRCLKASREKLLGIPTFDAIIFTSAKQQYLTASGILSRQQAQRNLRDIFREIAITLDEPAITQSAPEDQFHRVRQSLARQRTLLIVDNMETVQDTENIVTFLYDLPSNVKVVLTTREQIVHVPIRLTNLSPEEGQELIRQQADEKGIAFSDEESKRLYERTGGVPLAIVYAIGQVCSGYPLESVLEGLASNTGDVAEFCFKESVQGMRGQPPHKLLMSLAIFSDPPIRDAVAEVAGLTADPAAANRGLARLQQLSLVTQKDGRYSMLSLTREYALAELAAYPDFEKEARERWVKWYLDFAQTHGQKEWQEWHIQYDRLQEEGGNLLAVLDWCASQERYENIRDLWQNLRHYAHIYGYWEDCLFWMQWLIEASERRGELSTTVWAMAEQSWKLILMGQLEKAEYLLSQAWNMREHASFYLKSHFADYFAQLYISKKQYEQARYWLEEEEILLASSDLENSSRIRNAITVQYYRAEIHHKTCDYDRAKSLYQQVEKQGREINWQRAVYYAQGELAEIEIAQGNFDEAEKLLNTGLPVVERNKEKRRIAYYQASYARLEKARGNSPEAREWANNALKGFNSLGMLRDAEEMRQLIDSLK